ncbi:MAG: MFS transporter [Alphaproteobacteria bacterium]|nr:MFS transporter [Alphaproteobacteria bacterium]
MTATRETAGGAGASIETAYGWLVVTASTLILSVTFGGTYLVVVGLKPIAADFGWPRSIPSLAYTVIYVGAGFGGILMGWWSDRRGMFGPAIIGAVAIALGSILTGYSTEMVGFLFAQGILVGLIGNGAMFAPLMSNATRWFDRRRGMAVAIVASGQPLAGALWPSIFRWSIDAYGWRMSMIGYGIVALVIVLPLSLALRRPRPGNTPGSMPSRGEMDADGRVLGLRANLVLAMLGVAIVGCCIAMSMPMVHIVAYCSDLGYSAARGAEMLSLLLACAFMSRLIFGWTADRIGGLKTILLSSGLQAMVLSFYTLFDGMLGLYLLSALFGLVFGGIVPSYSLVVRELFPENQAGWRTGVVYLFGTIGMGLGGWLGGLIFDLTGGYQLAFITGVASNVVNLVLIMTLVWRSQPGPRLRVLRPA